MFRIPMDEPIIVTAVWFGQSSALYVLIKRDRIVASDFE